MAYVTYTTTAIVCGSKASNTSDRSYLLFTKEVGMVWATARSVREERSRQRYALQDCALITVSLVKGKAGWRIGSVEALGNTFIDATGRVGRAGVIVVIKFLRRFVHGEMVLPEVLEDAIAVMRTVSKANNVTTMERSVMIFELRALYQLGYVAKQEQFASLLPPSAFVGALSEQYGHEQLSPILSRAKDVSHL